MRIHIQTDTKVIGQEVTIGNVYACRGGRSMSLGYMHIVLAITEPKGCHEATKVLCLTIDAEGKLRDVTTYSRSYFDDKCPIAFCDGIDAIDLTLRSL